MILDHVIKLLKWCEAKILLSERPSNILFKEGEIWWCRIGMNIGHETYGKGASFSRPVLIFKKFSNDFFYRHSDDKQEKGGDVVFPIES